MDPFPRPIKSSNYLSPVTKAAIEQGRDTIRQGAQRFAENMVRIADTGKTIDGQDVPPQTQAMVLIWLMERIYGKNVQPLVAVVEGKTESPEQIAATLAKYGMDHLLPPDREVIDEPNANTQASQ
jgi:hypothetical protein